MNSIISAIKENLKFYKDFHTKLYLLMKEFEETEYLRAELYRIQGKMEVLEELKKLVVGKDEKAEDVANENKTSKAKAERMSRKSSENVRWISHGSFQYAVHDGRVLMRWVNKEGKRIWSRNFDYEKIKQLYEKLPEESYADDIVEMAKELGLNIDRKIAMHFMRVFANYVDFDAELIKEPGKTKPRSKLIKHNFSLADENKNKLKIEKEVIGTPYAVGD